MSCALMPDAEERAYQLLSMGTQDMETALFAKGLSVESVMIAHSEDDDGYVIDYMSATDFDEDLDDDEVIA